MTEIKKVGVLGSGIMGSGLAEVVARAELEVIVRSRTQAGADAVLHTVDSGLARHAAKGRLTEDERQSILGRISVTDRLEHVACRDHPSAYRISRDNPRRNGFRHRVRQKSRAGRRSRRFHRQRTALPLSK